VKTVSDPENASRAFLGVIIVPALTVPASVRSEYGMLILALIFFSKTLYWVGLFNLSIGFVNLLPLAPFDGYRMLREVVDSTRLGPTAVKKVTYAVSAAMLALLVANMIPLFVMLAQSVT